MGEKSCLSSMSRSSVLERVAVYRLTGMWMRLKLIAPRQTERAMRQTKQGPCHGRASATRELTTSKNCNYCKFCVDFGRKIPHTATKRRLQGWNESCYVMDV